MTQYSYRFGLFGALLMLLIPMISHAEKKPVGEALYQIIQDKGVDAAIATYHKLRKENPDQFDFSEAQLNSLGYRLLGENRGQAAVAILKLNSEMFPGSPNTFDSLGDAYVRNRDHSGAIRAYQMSLKLLSTATLDSRSTSFLRQNAERRLEILMHPEKRVKSTAVADFYDADAEFPFGKLHPNAPEETRFWGQLAGVWDCTQFALVNGRWVAGWPATWVWRYILDGFAIQDVWYQREIDLPPTQAGLRRDFVGTNMRIFDRVTGKWDVIWFQNGQQPGGTRKASSRFSAVRDGDRIIMTPTEQTPGAPWRRVVFYDITQNSFKWNSEFSEDGGNTWEVRFRIEGKRVK